jgi:membrane-bound serine protease (ClpP class)
VDRFTRILKSLIPALVLLGFFIDQGFAQNEDATGPWVAVDIGIISPASADILESALRESATLNASGLLIVLDTPGGSLASTREMVKMIMASPIPVAVWVGPDGARAGSAGAFITLSAHVAGMAPGTNIGAAHPVQAGGGDVGDSEMGRKIESDTKAFIESIAQTRNRNAEVAIAMVSESRSLTASQAKEQNIIDFISRNPSEFLAAADGLEVTFADGNPRKLSTAAVSISSYEKTMRQQLLEILVDPNLFYLLFLAGLVGIGFELTNPGSIFPGVIGAISLILALISASILPVSFGALLLALAGIAFIVAEFFMPSFGILGIGGFIAFITGSILLVDPGDEWGVRISMWTIIPSAFVFAGCIVGLCIVLLRSERYRTKSGAEGMVGRHAEVSGPFTEGRGRVRIDGEDWAAFLALGPNVDVAIQVGSYVRVKEVKGLNLIVEPI